MVLNIWWFTVPAVVVILYRNVAINERSELNAGNSGIRARSTVVYMEYRKVHLVVTGGYSIVVIKNIEDYSETVSCQISSRRVLYPSPPLANRWHPSLSLLPIKPTNPPPSARFL